MNAPATLRTLRTKVTQMREQLEERQAKRVKSTPEIAIKLKPGQEEIPLSPQLKQLFDSIQQAIKYDQTRLLPTTPPATEEVPEAETAPAPTTPVPPVAPSANVATPAITPEAMGPLVQDFARRFNATQPFLPMLRDTAAPLRPEVNQTVLALLQEELALLTESNLGHPPAPAALLMKLRQAATAYSEGRTTDTITLLKNALNGDPHNHTLLACLSQVFYGLAVNGAPTVLPEAREYALRSMIANEKQRPRRLHLYQYLALVSERHHSEERTLESLRTSNLLAPELTQGIQGLMGMNGASLRAWGVLATISPLLWSELEIRNILGLVKGTIGGAAVYLHWLRRPLLYRQSQNKVPDELINEIEEIVLESWKVYHLIDPHLKRFPVRDIPNPWVVKLRYLNTLSELCPALTFDTVLCNISLNNEGWNDGAFPHHEAINQLGDPNFHYWRQWAQTLTYLRDQRKHHIFPAEESLQFTDFVPLAESALEILKGVETSYIKSDLWDDLKPWLVRWQPDHLLAVATGSNQPRNRFTPMLAPFNSLYRRWQEPAFQSPLCSELIAETARRGGFANWAEVVAAFEGAVRLIDDPAHGMENTQKRALDAAKKQFPHKFKNKHANFGRPSGTSMALTLLPLAMLGIIFAAFTLSENLSQAVGITLAMMGVAGVLFLNLTKS